MTHTECSSSTVRTILTRQKTTADIKREITVCPPNVLDSDAFVPGHARGYSLRNLLPGNYDIFMRANTDAGAGAAGPVINVHIGEDRTRTHTVKETISSYVLLHFVRMCVHVCLCGCEDPEEISAVMYAILPLVMTSLVLLLACLAHSDM